MKRILTLITIILLTINVTAQDKHKVDSLMMVLKTSKEDTSKVNTLLAISREKIILGEYQEGRKYADEALALAEKMDYKKGIATSYNLIGNIYYYLADYPKALEYMQKALTINEQLKNKKGIVANLQGIGNVYYSLSDYPNALENWQKALALNQQLGNKAGIADNLLSIGNVYNSLTDNNEALEYDQKALTIYEQLGNKSSIARNLGNIGNVYNSLFDYPKALEYLQRALKVQEEIGDKDLMAWSNIVIGGVYEKQGKHSEALRYETKALSKALEIGDKNLIKYAYGELAVIDSAMGNLGGAYENYKLAMQYKDSMFNMENSKKISQLENAKKQVADSVKAADEKQLISLELKHEQTKRYALYGGLALIIIFAGFMINRYKESQKQKKRSDELLLNILPKDVAEELKNTGHSKGKSFDEVTVMFTDFKNFTSISEKMTPSELVKEIDLCFSAFDNIIHKHGIEKIKTIGDAYMCAGGLPVANKTHAEDTVKAALEIRDFMANHNKEKIAKGELPFEIRIGINTGPVVAGIVGVKKFAYDIWGDTVNLASRMESSGEAGKVNISGSTYQLIKEKFTCTHRGKIMTKNKGEVDMYFVSN